MASVFSFRFLAVSLKRLHSFGSVIVQHKRQRFVVGVFVCFGRVGECEFDEPEE